MSTAVFPISLEPTLPTTLVNNVKINKKMERKYLPLLTASVLFIVLVVQLCVRISIIQKSYAIEELRQENLLQDRELRALRLRYESVTSPRQLRLRAESELGMGKLKPQQVRHLIAK